MAEPANNVMRQTYRPLTPQEHDQMTALKAHGLAFWELVNNLGTSRELSVAKTKIEEAVMWATKHLTA